MEEEKQATEKTQPAEADWRRVGKVILLWLPFTVLLGLSVSLYLAK